MERRVETLEEVAEPTRIPNLRLINGAEELLGIANPKFSQKTRLLTHLERLSAEVILLDLGAGTSTTSLDFFLYAAGKIAVLTPQVTSIQNAYGFIKASVFRKLTRVFTRDKEALELIHAAADSGNASAVRSVADLRATISAMSPEHQQLMARCTQELQMSLVLNMVREPRERDAARVVSSVAQRYLDVSPDVLGIVDYDPELDRSINSMPKYLEGGRLGSARLGMYDITSKVLKRVREGVTPTPEPIFEPEDDPALTE
jgi:flagellar biosynthesis protein FlhG